MYPEGMKGNEPTNGEDRFPRSPGCDNWKAESLELNSLDTTVTRKRNSEAPSARFGCGLLLSKLVPEWVIE